MYLWWLNDSEKSSTMELKPHKIKFKIRLDKGTSLPPPEFGKGKTVEVGSDEKGYEGSWFSAIVIDYIGLVEYLTLKTDDKTEPLREEAYSRYIRPYPPHLPARRFKQLGKVDAWYNDGWWVGVISKVLKGSSYVVYFSTSNEELNFNESNLRLHHDWSDGKWVIASWVGTTVGANFVMNCFGGVLSFRFMLLFHSWPNVPPALL
ncbi:protein AGENET DOMAIN (AGD)-CONTAINING P1-like [Eucalyptus grandis]|uniref:protein AGENET DOMAIN (AGD)-CONTAINING P1-like n=1 Tax=Eucalyptus grandis TaxID=71139 RepID=UPI00192EFEB6|nr:protein AGENET DOMAIN (AGD)-CONTAINING P1-like [Eucalyptus grandis]